MADLILTAILTSWRFDPALILALLAAVWLYMRGWRQLHAQSPHRYTTDRLAAFLTGVAALFLALESPLDAFGNLLLTAHMVQHLLLIAVAPPLILMGQPVLPILRGLPPRVLKNGLGPFLAWGALRRAARAITNPGVTWVAMAAAVVGWHLPRAYELGLSSPAWHGVEHACFFYAAILFWWPVIQVWPSRAQWPRWAMIPYLILADLVNTALSAWLVFSARVVYRTYEIAPRLGAFRAIDDQSTAGAIMWVPGSIVYLIPAFFITMQIVNVNRRKPALVQIAPVARRPKPHPVDLLRLPVIGRVMRHRYFRRVLQTALFVLALAVAIDGFTGTQIAPLNLAGVMPWTYWRGFAVIALLACGNLFCMACPFMLPRELGRRFLPARIRWPRAMRSKWLAAVLLVAYFSAYEFFSLWSSPWWTAWIIAGYFVTAFVVDGFFRGASFCKYVCPIGQFHFVNSLVSPFEVKVRHLETCGICPTHDCIRGNETHRGCELQLFQPRKNGNFDCTFCLDCVQACPQDNVGIIAAAPGRALLQPRISGIGRITARPDVAFLAWALVFGALVNAAAMITSLSVPSWMLYAAGFVAAPALLSWKSATRRFALAMIPLGFAMWVAHFSFHLVTGWRSILPVFARMFHIAGAAGFSAEPPSWFPQAQLLVLGAGLVMSVYLVWRMAKGFIVTMPWAILAITIYAASVWILFQPMQMRGMLM